ncbi:MAG TPA: TauD/TfdA family dioxygenase [Blastocatellia bacterium]
MDRRPESRQALLAFPESGRVEVPPEVAAELFNAAEALPLYDNKDFYSPELQLHVLAQIETASESCFDWLVDMIRSCLTVRPYCALVRGLRFDAGNKLFVAVSRAFGELVAPPYAKPRAQLVHYIQPETDIASKRGGRESERLHTDAADWEAPVDFVSMLCVRADRDGGGRSRILDVDAVRDAVKNCLGVAALEKLETESVPWRLAPYRGGGVRWRPVLTERTICWRRYTIELARNSQAAGLSPKMLTLLDSFEQVVSSAPGTVDFLMREGELLFSDNNRTIHARTPIGEGRSDRLMLRSWIKAA